MVACLWPSLSFNCAQKLTKVLVVHYRYEYYANQYVDTVEDIEENTAGSQTCSNWHLQHSCSRISKWQWLTKSDILTYFTNSASAGVCK